jgi:Na+-transporting NADH:ubiquinone oxidoreductase subunit NqrA
LKPNLAGMILGWSSAKLLFFVPVGNSHKIWTIWKKDKLNSEKIGKIWKKGKLNSEKI